MRDQIRSGLGAVLAFVLSFVPVVVAAQTFGLNTQETVIPAQNWVPAGSGYQFSGGGGITPTTNGAQTWVAAVGVPSGAIITAIDFLVIDNDSGSDISMAASLSSFPVTGSNSCGGNFATATSVGISGQGTVTMMNPYGAFPLRYRGFCNSVDSYLNYFISVTLQTTNHSLFGARISWNRSVSPAPGSATFNDVPTSDFGFQYVEALAASGITGGCGGGDYCPNEPVTRRQMAIFLAKALGLYFPQ